MNSSPLHQVVCQDNILIKIEGKKTLEKSDVWEEM